MGSKQSIEDKARVNAVQSALSTWDVKSIEDTAGNNTLICNSLLFAVSEPFINRGY